MTKKPAKGSIRRNPFPEKPLILSAQLIPELSCIKWLSAGPKTLRV